MNERFVYSAHDDAKLAIVSIVWRKIASLEYIAVSDKLCFGRSFRTLSIHMKQHEKTEQELSKNRSGL